MTITLRQVALLTLVIAVATFALVLGSFAPANASAPTGLKTTIGTTSVAAVTSTASMLFASSTCDARIISTQGSAVMLTFSDYNGARPTASFGHVQAASTTVAYDSGLYGCGAVYAYSFSNQNLTVSEAR